MPLLNTLQSDLDNFDHLSKEQLYELIAKHARELTQASGIIYSPISTHKNYQLLKQLSQLFLGVKTLSSWDGRGDPRLYKWYKISSVITQEFIPKLAYCFSQREFNRNKALISMQLHCLSALTPEQQASLNELVKHVGELSVLTSEASLSANIATAIVAAGNDCRLQRITFEHAAIVPGQLQELTARFPQMTEVSVTGTTLQNSDQWHISMSGVNDAKSAGNSYVNIRFIHCDLQNALDQIQRIRQPNPDVLLRRNILISITECSLPTQAVTETVPRLTGISGNTVISTDGNQWIISRNPEASTNQIIGPEVGSVLTADIMQSFLAATVSGTSRHLQLSGDAVTRWLDINTPERFSSVCSLTICQSTLSSEHLLTERLGKNLNQSFPNLWELTFEKIALSSGSAEDKKLVLAQVLTLPSLNSLSIDSIADDKELEYLATLIASNPKTCLASITVTKSANVTQEGLDRFASLLKDNITLLQFNVKNKHPDQLSWLLTRNNWRLKHRHPESEMSQFFNMPFPPAVTIHASYALFEHLNRIGVRIDEIASYHADINLAKKLYSQLAERYLELLKSISSLQMTDQLSTHYTHQEDDRLSLAQMIFNIATNKNKPISDYTTLFSCILSTNIEVMAHLILQWHNSVKIMEYLKWLHLHTDEVGHLLIAKVIAQESYRWEATEFAMLFLQAKKDSNPSVYHPLYIELYKRYFRTIIAESGQVYFQRDLHNWLQKLDKQFKEFCLNWGYCPQGPYYNDEARQVIYSGIFTVINLAQRPLYSYDRARWVSALPPSPPFYCPTPEVLSVCENTLKTIAGYSPNKMPAGWLDAFLNVYRTRLLLLIATEYNLDNAAVVGNDPIPKADAAAIELITKLHKAEDFSQLISFITVYINALGFFGARWRSSLLQQLNILLPKLQDLADLQMSKSTSFYFNKSRKNTEAAEVVKDKSIEVPKEKSDGQVQEKPADNVNDEGQADHVRVLVEEDIEEKEQDQRRQEAAQLLAIRGRDSIGPNVAHTLLAPPKAASIATAKAAPKEPTLIVVSKIEAAASEEISTALRYQGVL